MLNDWEHNLLHSVNEGSFNISRAVKDFEEAQDALQDAKKAFEKAKDLYIGRTHVEADKIKSELNAIYRSSDWRLTGSSSTTSGRRGVFTGEVSHVLFNSKTKMTVQLDFDVYKTGGFSAILMSGRKGLGKTEIPYNTSNYTSFANTIYQNDIGRSE